mgnify:FL=1
MGFNNTAHSRYTLKNRKSMEHVKKPEWLKISIGTNARYTETKQIVDTHKLHTICLSLIHI